MRPSQATALKCLLRCGFRRRRPQNGSDSKVGRGLPPSRTLSYLHQWSSAGPRPSEGVKSKGRHLELPASPNTVAVPSDDVQVVMEDHCGEAPLVGPEGEFCEGTPASALLRTFQGEDMSGRFRLQVVPGSQVLLPEAAQTRPSLHPQADNFVLLLSAQTPEARIRVWDKKEAQNIINVMSCQQGCYQGFSYITRRGSSSRFLLM